MSRTDKQLPYYVVATLWYQWHEQCPHSRFYRGRECDLPPEPLVKNPGRWSYKHKPRCSWQPDWETLPRHYRRHKQSIPAWFVHDVWNGPDRVRTRDRCREAVKEYRGSGDVETEVPVDQHHHCAKWWW